MKNLLLAALIALPMTLVSLSAQAAAGRAACGSDTDNIHSVQFGWDDKGELTDVSLTRSNEPESHSDENIVDFDLTKAHHYFAQKNAETALTVYDGKGNWVSLNVTVDAERVGKGEISWGIAQDNFKEKRVTSTCSF